MTTHTNLKITNLWDILRLNGFNLLPDRQVGIRLTEEESFGDPTEEIASYQPSRTPEAARQEYAGLDEFERDFHWFLA